MFGLERGIMSEVVPGLERVNDTERSRSWARPRTNSAANLVVIVDGESFHDFSGNQATVRDGGPHGTVCIGGQYFNAIVGSVGMSSHCASNVVVSV